MVAFDFEGNSNRGRNAHESEYKHRDRQLRAFAPGPLFEPCDSARFSRAHDPALQKGAKILSQLAH